MSTESAPKPPEKVLTTLDHDGKRIWMRPKLSVGRYLNRRKIVGYFLIFAFLILPFVKIGGHPAILLDVTARRFHLFGVTFHPTDSALLMLLALSVLLGIFWLTALVGRVWCGWGCPQTVYMELLFRPIERLIEGNSGQQRQLDKQTGFIPPPRRLLKYGVFLLVAFLLGNQFLSYFVGWERLSTWMTSSPAEHMGGFGVMAVTTALVYFDFTFFREQMCTVVCPYARLQSALLDRHSLIVGYDTLRGEARKRVKARTEGDGSGDCIDCKACVATCPTGIDIRDGLQLECINCTQCIDACDNVMDKIGKPHGLIRLSSQHALETKEKPKLLRPRTLLYPAIILVLMTALVVLFQNKGEADVTILRQLNAPFVVTGDVVRNQLRVKVVNRAEEERIYSLEIEGVADSNVLAPQFPLKVRAGGSMTTPILVNLPKERLQEADGTLPVKVKVTDEKDNATELPYVLLGPGKEN